MLESSVVANASPEALFALSQDYANRLAWDPFLKSAEFVGGATEPAVGVRTFCTARNGLAMETEYVSYNPPRATAVRMTRGPWIFDSFAGSWRFEALSEGQTRVTFRYQFHARPRWLRFLIEPILRRVLDREMRQRLVALKRAAEAVGK